MLTETATEWLVNEALPALVDSLAGIAKELKRANDLKELELKGANGGWEWCSCEAGPPYHHSGRCPECGGRVPTY